MLLFAKPGIDSYVLAVVNDATWRLPAIAGAARLLAVFGALPLVVITVFWAVCGSTRRRIQGGWITLISASIAFAIALGLQDLILRPRPFIYHPVRLLICYPNNASFPSLQMAVGAALAFGLFAYGGRFRGLLPAYLLLVGIARIGCAVEYPTDVFSAWIIGSVTAFLLALLLNIKKVAARSDGGWIIFAGLLVLTGTSYLAFRLPRIGIHSEQSSYTKTNLVKKDNGKIIKGFSPEIEKPLAERLVKWGLPGRIMKVAVGSSKFSQVAAVKFLAVRSDRRIAEIIIQRQALAIIKGTFQTLPQVKEVDVWAVIPNREPNGADRDQVVFSVSAQRPNAAFLFSNEMKKLTPPAALSRFGWRKGRSNVR